MTTEPLKGAATEAMTARLLDDDDIDRLIAEANGDEEPDENARAHPDEAAADAADDEEEDQ